MPRRRFRLALLAFIGGAAVTSGCSPEPQRQATPAVWMARDADTILYITGTVHLLPDDIAWTNGPIVGAMAAADELVTELSPQEIAGVALTARPYLYGAQAQPLADRFPADLRDDFTRIERSLPDVPDEARLDDWAVALLLAQLVAARAGLEGDNGMDEGLIAAFGDQRKRRSGLESAADQFGRFDAIPPDEQRRALIELMRHIAGGTADDRMREMVEAWANGDVAALAAIIARDAAKGPATYRLLLTERNARWAMQLEQRMAQPGTVLVAVGAGHLAGPDSLIAMLAARGIRAERLR